MRSRIYPAETREHYEDLLAAIGSRPVEPEQWIARRDARRARARQRRRRPIRSVLRSRPRPARA
jgi:hypothetical protein